MTKKLITMIPTEGKTTEEMKETINQMWPDIQDRINKINEEAEKNGLAPDPDDNIQVISFWKNPKYPKKNIFQRVKRYFFSCIGRAP